ncbi:MAG: type I-E CRISPR-associated protein Cas6/Cse3/CasE [Proteobacteria bacterium]|nr:type I-E CRISPR-associated protein Cas6/Cse3/CasE [Pseudomonadota bacterium]MCK4499070.1 type I-E CRISPR-associated protein Cas6/Cse3/CasE [Candidatus Babeliales bacterium]
MYFSRIRIRPEIFKSTQLAKLLSDSSYNMHRLLWDLFSNEQQRNFLYREEIAHEQLGIQAGVRGEPIYYVVSSTRPSLENPFFQVEAREYQPKLQKGDLLSFELRANPVVTKKVDRENPEHYLRERSRRQVANKNKLTKKRVRHDVVMDAQRTFLTSLCAELNLQSRLPSAPKKQEVKKALLTHGGHTLDGRLTTLLKNDFSYAERLRQSMQLHSKIEWSIKAIVDDALEKWMIRQGQRHGFLLAKNDNNQCKLQNSAYRWHSIKSDKGKKSGFSSVDFLGNLEITDIEKFTKALFGGIGRAKAFGCGLMLVRRV